MRHWHRSALFGLVLSGGLVPLRATAQVTDVQVAPPQVQLRAGDSSQVFATAYGPNGNVVVGPAIRWSSTDSTVVQVRSDPMAPDVATLVAVAPGAAVVEARVGNARGFTTVSVPAPTPAAPPLAAAPVPVPVPVLPDSVLPAGIASGALRSLVRVDAQRFGVPATCASGVVIGRGLVATSYQAVRGASRLSVTPEGGAVTPEVQIASYSVATDLAILRLPVERDTVAVASAFTDNQFAWIVGYPGCQAAAVSHRIRVTSWENRPAGMLRYRASLAESEHGAAIIEQSGALVGVVNGDRTAAVPFSRVQTTVSDARANVAAGRLQSVEDVARTENHLYGSFTVRTDATGTTARVTPLDTWQWAGLGRESAPPFTFVGPMGRYQVDLMINGTSRATSVVRIIPAANGDVSLSPPAPAVAQAPPQAAPAPAPQPSQPPATPPQQVAKKGGGGAVVPLVLLGLGGGGAAVFFLTKKKDDSTATGIELRCAGRQREHDRSSEPHRRIGRNDVHLGERRRFPHLRARRGGRHDLLLGLERLRPER